MNSLRQQVTRYIGASAIALMVDVGLLAFQVSVLGMPYLVAATVSFLAGTIVVYWSAIRHIFDYRRLSKWTHEFSIFALIGCAGLILNLGAIYILVDWFGVHYLLAKLGAAGATFIANFVLRRWILFLPNRTLDRAMPERRGVSS